MICPQCKKEFEKKRHNQRFCSARCKWTFDNHHRKLKPNVIYNCKVCGKHVEKYISPWALKNQGFTNEYCSRKCKGIALSGVNHPMWGRHIYRTNNSKHKRIGTIRNGEKHPMWRGGISIKADGYILIHNPHHPHSTRRGYVPEHRLVMEKHLGRILDKNGVVHHENGDPSDNRIENLKLFKSQAEHKLYHEQYRQKDCNGRYLKINEANSNYN